MDSTLPNRDTRDSETPRAKLAWMIRTKGLRRAFVAEAAGISVSYLSRLTSGDRAITPEMAEKLASALNIDAAELLPGEGGLR